MSPSRTDVQRLAEALFTVSEGLQRARRRIPDAATLTVLQVLAGAEKADPDQRVRPSDIAAALGVHRSAVTRHLQSLEEAGQLTLAVDPDDRRSWIVRLTDAGRDEVARLTTVGLERFMLFVADWDADEVRTLTELLIKFDKSKTPAAETFPPATTSTTPRSTRRPSATR
jgi:DNA-binding MarR family transcriptional regulator